MGVSSALTVARVSGPREDVFFGRPLSLNVQRETTFPQGMSRRQAAPALPPGAEA